MAVLREANSTPTENTLRCSKCLCRLASFATLQITYIALAGARLFMCVCVWMCLCVGRRTRCASPRYMDAANHMQTHHNDGDYAYSKHSTQAEHISPSRWRWWCHSIISLAHDSNVCVHASGMWMPCRWAVSVCSRTLLDNNRTPTICTPPSRISARRASLPTIEQQLCFNQYTHENNVHARRMGSRKTPSTFHMIVIGYGHRICCVAAVTHNTMMGFIDCPMRR